MYRLDKDEFRAFVTRLARNMGTTFEAVAELLILTASAASPEDAAVSSSLQLFQVGLLVLIGSAEP